MLSKCLLQLPISLWRASLFVWLLRPLTLSIPDNMCTAILWFEVGNSFGKLGFNVRKKPLRLNKMRDPIPSVNCLPILFPAWSPGPAGGVCHSQLGVLCALPNNPNQGGLQVCRDHSFSCLCLFCSKGVSESCDEASLFLEKKERERGRKITISHVYSIIAYMFYFLWFSLQSHKQNRQNKNKHYVLIKELRPRDLPKLLGNEGKNVQVTFSFHSIPINHISRSCFPGKLSLWL